MKGYCSYFSFRIRIIASIIELEGAITTSDLLLSRRRNPHNKISQQLQRKIFSGLLLLDRSDSRDPEYHVRCPWVVFICKHSTSSREEENQLRSFCVQDVCTHISLRLGKQSQNLPTFLLLFYLWSLNFGPSFSRLGATEFWFGDQNAFFSYSHHRKNMGEP